MLERVAGKITAAPSPIKPLITISILLEVETADPNEKTAKIAIPI